MRFMVKNGFADFVFSAELDSAFFVVHDLLNEFKFEFWCVDFVAHGISFGENSPHSFRRGYWSQVKGLHHQTMTTPNPQQG
jgi:hypothetical protein